MELNIKQKKFLQWLLIEFDNPNSPFYNSVKRIVIRNVLNKNSYDYVEKRNIKKFINTHDPTLKKRWKKQN